MDSFVLLFIFPFLFHFVCATGVNEALADYKAAREYLRSKGVSDEEFRQAVKNNFEVTNSTICVVHMLLDTFKTGYYEQFENRTSQQVFDAYLDTFDRKEKMRRQLNTLPISGFTSLGDEHLLRRFSEHAALSYCNDSSVERIGTLNTRMGSFTVVGIYHDYLSDPMVKYTFNNDTKTLVVTFRGSQNQRDWFADGMGARIHPNATDGILAQAFTTNTSMVHGGFWGRYVVQRENVTIYLNEAIQKSVQIAHSDNIDIVVVGHSLGAAWASLQTADWILSGYKISALFTYGSPMVGNYEFVKTVQDIIGAEKIARVANRNDIIVHVGYTPDGAHFPNATEYFVPDLIGKENVKVCNGGTDPKCSSKFPCLRWSWYHHSEFAGFSMHGDFCRMNQTVPLIV